MSTGLDERPAIDRRIAARRELVREARARRRLRWLLVLLGLAGGAALVAWLLYHSSLLSVSTVTISGVERSAARSIVAEAGVAPGMATANVPAGTLEAALAADPWIAAANVTVRWPGTVEVTVIEHVPAAWVASRDGWLLVAEGGAVLEVATTIPDDAPRVDLGPLGAVPGDTLTPHEVLAAVEFVNRLPADLVPGAVVTGDDSSIAAHIAGYDVDLGYPSDVAEKAAALAALLETEAPVEGSLISVVAPSRPAVLEPSPAGAVEEPATDDGEGDG